MKTKLMSTVLALACTQGFAQTFTPVTDASGQIFGYKDEASCLIWPVPAAFAINTVMRHDKEYFVGASTQYFSYSPIAAAFAAGLWIGGQNGWRLPTVDEASRFFKGFYQPSTPSVLQLRVAVAGTYWASDVNGSQAAAVRPSASGPILQWFSRTAVNAFVWPVVETACSATINPFGTMQTGRSAAK